MPSLPPAISTRCSIVVVADAPMRAVVIVPAGKTLLVSGSKTSAVASAEPSAAAPPTISTVSSKSRVEACHARALAMVPAKVEVPVARSKISMSLLGALPTRPPLTSTRPSASRVVAAFTRGANNCPTLVNPFDTGS